MSILSVAEKLIKHGTALGMISDEIGLTGEGGLIHDNSSEPVVIFRKTECYFTENGVSLPWDCIGKVLVNDETDQLEIFHKGGLHIDVPTARWARQGEDDESVCRAIEEKLADGLHEVSEYFDFDDYDSADVVIGAIEEALSLIEDSKKTYELLEGSSDLVFDEAFALCDVSIFMECLKDLLSQDSENKNYDRWSAVRDWRDNNIERLSEAWEIADYWRERCSREYEGNAEILKICARTYAKTKYEYECGVLPIDKDGIDEIKYSWIQSAYGDAEMPDSDVWTKWIDEQWASLTNAKHRKTIVCTEEPQALDQIGEIDPECSIVRARDLVAVIERQRADDDLETPQGQRKAARDSGNEMPMVQAMSAAKNYKAERAGRRLVFEVGHPRNDTIYVQHPFTPNTYVELSSFHASMLERKYNELIRILIALGAKHIECSVENTDKCDESIRDRVDTNAAVSAAGAIDVSGEASNSRHSTQSVSLYKKLNTEMDLIPNGAPHLPDGLLYYPFEEGWKRVADDVMAGRLVKAKIDLVYSTDYAITGRFTSSLKAKIESKIPTYRFGVGGGLETEVETELKKLESTVWHYTVEFGLPEAKATKASIESSAIVNVKQKIDEKMTPRSAPASNDNERIEKLLLGKARQFAKADGVDLSAAHHDQLVALGGKYGVDELRVEEIILSACEEIS